MLSGVSILQHFFSVYCTGTRNIFFQHGIEAVVPTVEEQHLINKRIFSEIELGVFNDSTRDELLDITRRMIGENGSDCLLPACTELPLILTKSTCGIPFPNTASIHVRRDGRVSSRLHRVMPLVNRGRILPVTLLCTEGA